MSAVLSLRRWRGIRSLIAGLVTVSIPAMASGQQIAVRAGVTVAPDSVRIGDPFRVTVGIRAPRGATIEFPTATDSTSTVQSLDPVAVRTSADTSVVEQYADYRVAAWDVGPQPIRLGEAVVHVNGALRRISLGGHTVFVRSVLPADTAQRKPKPLRDIFEFHPFPWWLAALIAAAIIAIGLLIWWWIRRRRRPKPPVVIDPYARAESEFERIEALGLLDAGERGRYVTLVIEVLRDYLAARYAEAALSLTSSELDQSVRLLPYVPRERLTRLLSDADLVKFARRPVSSERSRDIGRESRTIVQEEHRVSQPTAKAGKNEVAA
jgi:hypothetical protein